jgi:photosystem II stability/assembly factor-like uncharacterized protein
MHELIYEINRMRPIAAKTIAPRLCTALRLSALVLSALLGMGALHGAEAGVDVWTTNGPEGPNVWGILALAIDPQTPTTLYAAAHRDWGNGGGVFKTTDGGGRWSAVNVGLTDALGGPEFVTALAVDPQTPTTLYAGTDSGGVFKSIDAGGHWSAVNTGLTGGYICTLAIDPQTPTTLYAGTEGGVFKSADGGGTWTAVNTGLTNLNVRSLAVDPRTPITLYAGTGGGGVFKSTDGGGTWTAVNAGLTAIWNWVNGLAIDPQTPTTVYAATYSGVFKSTDGGGTWSAVNSGLTDLSVYALAIDPRTPTTLYAGGSGVFKSTDGGGTWSTGLSGGWVVSLVIDPTMTTILYAGDFNAGVSKSTDGGGAWSAVNTGLTYTSIASLAIDPKTPTTLYAGASGGGVFKSTDGGGTWNVVTTAPPNITFFRFVVDPLTTSTLYAAAWGSGVFKGVFKSTDAGGTWSEVNTGLTNLSVQALAIDPNTPTTLYAGTEGGGVFKTIDGALTWMPVNTGLINLSIHALAIDPGMPTILYAGHSPSYPRRISKSIDGGTTWFASDAGLPDDEEFWIDVLTIDPLTPTTLYAASLRKGGVWKSTNGGASWGGAGRLGWVTGLVVDPQTPTNLYASTWGGGVWKSTDGGLQWSALNTGLSDLDVQHLAIDPETPTTVYAGTRFGVFALQQQDPTLNRPPLANAGPDQVVEATDPDGALVILDGSGSSDPDADPLSFTWLWPFDSATGVRPTVRLPLGTTTVRLTVTDSEGATGTDTVQITVRDTAAPTVALTSPSDGATVTGTITMKASASDAVGVGAVQFLVDGMVIGEDATEPYEVPWDTRTASDGTHTLAARARDAAGNSAISAPVRVTVANGPLPTLTLSRSEETSARLAGGWFEITSAGVGVTLSGGRAVAAAAEATASFTFTGTGVRWIGVPCEICGIATVLIDGTRVATVDTFAATRPAASMTVYTSPRLAVGSHTLVIEVTGTANAASGGAFVVVDAFETTVDGGVLVSPISLAPSSVTAPLL